MNVVRSIDRTSSGGYGERGPWSTSWAIEIEQGEERDFKGFSEPEQLQVGGIPSAKLQATHVRAVEARLPGQLFLSPVLGRAQFPDTLAQLLEGRVGDRAGRHRQMLTTVYTPVYRPGSTPVFGGHAQCRTVQDRVSKPGADRFGGFGDLGSPSSLNDRPEES
jgi:hypothetical protein